MVKKLHWRSQPTSKDAAPRQLRYFYSITYRELFPRPVDYRVSRFIAGLRKALSSNDLRQSSSPQEPFVPPYVPFPIRLDFARSSKP